MTGIFWTLIIVAIIALCTFGMGILRAAAMGDADAEARAKELRKDEVFRTKPPEDKPKRFLETPVKYCNCCQLYWGAGSKVTWTLLPAEYYCDSEKLCDSCCQSIAGQGVEHNRKSI